MSGYQACENFLFLSKVVSSPRGSVPRTSRIMWVPSVHPCLSSLWVSWGLAITVSPLTKLWTSQSCQIVRSSSQQGGVRHSHYLHQSKTKWTFFPSVPQPGLDHSTHFLHNNLARLLSPCLYLCMWYKNIPTTGGLSRISNPFGRIFYLISLGRLVTWLCYGGPPRSWLSSNDPRKESFLAVCGRIKKVLSWPCNSVHRTDFKKLLWRMTQYSFVNRDY